MCGRSWCRGAAAESCGETRGKTAEINTRSSLNRGKKGWSWTLLLQIRNRELEQDRGQRVCRVQTRVLNCCHWYFRKATTTTVIIEAFSTHQNSVPNFALWVLYSEGSRFPKVSMSTLMNSSGYSRGRNDHAQSGQSFLCPGSGLRFRRHGDRETAAARHSLLTLIPRTYIASEFASRGFT